MKMIFLPSRELLLKTSKTPEEVCSVLQSVTQPRYSPFLENCEFTGRVDRGGFSICQRVSCRSSFLPVVRGRVIPRGNGCEIALQMEIRPTAAMFSLIWMGVVLLIFLIGLLMLALGITGVWPLALASGGMAAGGQLLIQLSFCSLAGAAERRIEELLKS